MIPVFLDFDGVLNKEERVAVVPPWVFVEGYDWKEQWILPHLVARLRPLLNVPGTGIVVTSRWRFYWSDANLRRILNYAYGGVGDRILGTTSRRLRRNRTSEISAWLEEAQMSNYVVLDDSELLGHRSRLVRTNAVHGLTEDDVHRAIDIVTRGARRSAVVA